LWSLLLGNACSQRDAADAISNPNQPWHPKLELALTWPNGSDGPHGEGVYVSLLALYAPPVDLDQIRGDYLVVAERFPDSSKGRVSLLINRQSIPNVVDINGNKNYWALSTNMKVECPNSPKTVIPPLESIPLDAPLYSVICVSSQGITRILFHDVDLGYKFPTELSSEGENFLSELGISLSPALPAVP
jgi:hypothetical protein